MSLLHEITVEVPAVCLLKKIAFRSMRHCGLAVGIFIICVLYDTPHHIDKIKSKPGSVLYQSDS